MNKLVCPHCKKDILIDENDYKNIIGKVRDEVFNEELAKKLELVKIDNEKTIKINNANAETKLERAINEKQKVIMELEMKIKSFEQEIELALSNQKAKINEELSEKDKKIIELKSKVSESQLDKQNALTMVQIESREKINSIENEKNKIINELENKLNKAHEENKLELKEQEIKSINILNDKENEINFLTRKYESDLKDKEEEIDRIKNNKVMLSTKLIGETLEKHCENEFNKVRSYGFENAYFEKDNDSSKGSKGDYIFKDYSPDGIEYISIMFEMKNESEETEKKHKNEDFYKKLDKDRRDKGCEYAVLVSLLEKDNALFNEGILDVGHKYEKMYVIRPQFFIQIISLLRNASRKSIKYLREIEEYKAQNIDIVRFENNMLDFKEKFGKNYLSASKAFDEAINSIDKSIKDLENTKEKLLSSNRQMRLANDKAQDLTIKKLAKNAPSLLEKHKNNIK